MEYSISIELDVGHALHTRSKDLKSSEVDLHGGICPSDFGLCSCFLVCWWKFIPYFVVWVVEKSKNRDSMMKWEFGRDIHTSM
ncbi:uncharacterized protein BO95DRAFT_439080 [Aspergillus brunneoviolaceus CBS 621.78]|uniref:Uncharacterized protein n=1 Tax=Aspergillus brunneoviolaceus CBS 621.78 TaxID=1450534 RepID=A0ACD1GKS0_9EURO|nr:hypothetical protein BO95DRAFT_439080 [Aspergillus brunneoviolaceus CBS 621.78]RAH49866.1 hypothetical protein BO95DRAFT_439080 [Aspergillus brunneoviolaceus CBS 621.78]